MQIVARTPTHAVVAANGHFRIVDLVAMDRETIFEAEDRATFPNWKEIVALFLEIGFSDLFRAAREKRLPGRLSNLKLWTVPLERHSSRQHDEAWEQLCEEHAPEFEDRQWEAPAVGDKRLSTSGASFSFDGSLDWSDEELVQMLCFVLSDARTQEVGEDQYAPFLGKFCEGSSITVELPEQEEADTEPVTTVAEAPRALEEVPAPVTPAPAAEAGVKERARARWEQLLAKEGLV